MKKKVYKVNLIEKTREVPHRYALCVKSACPVASVCLRHKLYEENVGRSATIVVVNPKENVLGADGKCCHFADGVHPATYALGFLHFVNGLSRDQKKRFQGRCLQSIGKTVYYEMRASERVITPEWQAFLLRVAEQEDIPVPRCFFDSTFEAPAW